MKWTLRDYITAEILEAQPVLCISEVRNFVSYFTKGYYKTITEAYYKVIYVDGRS